MAIRSILNLSDDIDHILRKRSRPVTEFNEKLSELLDDLGQTLHRQEGVGLAAPQVGVLRRVVVVDVGEGVIELVNPVILKKSGKQENVEGCLSIPGRWGITRRPMKVTVKAQDRDGKEFTVSGEELLARAFCHEIDHLDGKLFIDNVVRMLDDKELRK